MKIHNVQQNSLEWLAARAGVVTASEFSDLFTPKLEPRKGQMVETYLNRKIAERWTGSPSEGCMTLDMEFGKLLEEEARPWYEFTFEENVQVVGLCTTDDGRLGCSPDGLLGADGGIEIKCPAAHTHVGYLREGGVPEKYLPQVHGSLFVTGRKFWRFVSYRRRFPKLVVTVERDEKIMATMAETLAAFVQRIDEGIARIKEMN